jgi:hypothetical protein
MAKGSVIIKETYRRHSFALALNRAPGTHAGTYFTGDDVKGER